MTDIDRVVTFLKESHATEVLPHASATVYPFFGLIEQFVGLRVQRAQEDGVEQLSKDLQRDLMHGVVAAHVASRSGVEVLSELANFEGKGAIFEYRPRYGFESFPITPWRIRDVTHVILLNIYSELFVKLLDAEESTRAARAAGLPEGASPLALHLLSEHRMANAHTLTPQEQRDAHTHEHAGPGTIRNHAPAATGWTAFRVLETLKESGS